MMTTTGAGGAPADRGAAHAAGVDAVELVLLLAFLAVAAVGWAGITLAEFGVFGPTALSAATIVLLIVLLRIVLHDAALFDVDSLRVPRRDAAWGLGLLAACAIAYLPPAEQVFDGADASVYLNVGARLAHEGSLRFRDPLLDLAAGIPLESLFARDLNPPPLLHRFRGGIQIAADGRQIVPNFFHLYSVLIAAIALPFGLQAAMLLNPALATGGVLTVWAIARRLWSNAAGVTAAALLLVSFGQVWFARFASSEMLAQYLLLSGVLFAILCARGGPRAIGAAAGLAFGLAAFTRIDALFLATPAVVLLLLVVRAVGAWSPAWTACAVTLGLVTAQAVAHAFTIAAPYTQRILGETGGHARLPALVGAAGLLLVAFAVVRWMRVRGRFGTARGWTMAPRARAALALAPLAFAIVAALVLQVDPFAGHFAKLVTPAGLVLAAIGLGLLFAFSLRLDTLTTVLLFVPSAVMYLQSTRDGRDMPMLFRRFVPIVLPMAMVFIGGIAGALGRYGKWPRRAAIAGLAAYGVVLATASWPILRDRPMRHVFPQVQGIADRLPPDALILVDRVAPSHLPLTLAYAFDRMVLAVDRTGGLEALVRRALQRGIPVHALVRGDERDDRSLTRTDLSPFVLRPESDVTLRYDALASTREALPRTIEPRTATLHLYQVLPIDAPQGRLRLPAVVDVGAADFPYVLEGFHAPETMAGVTARWTTGEAQVVLAPIEDAGGGPLRLRLRVAAYRPPGIGAPPLDVELNRTPLGTVPAVGPGFEEHTFAVPAALAGDLRRTGGVVLLRTRTFSPATTGSDDDRILGVAVDVLVLESDAAAASR